MSGKTQAKGTGGLVEPLVVHRRGVMLPGFDIHVSTNGSANRRGAYVGCCESEQYAQLFAAAPDLLAALLGLLEQLHAIGIPDWHGAEGLSLGASIAALAKAVPQ